MSDLLWRPGLEALIDEATQDARWRSRNHLAGECGIHPTSLSLALSGKRPLSDAALDALVEGTKWGRDILLIPAQARRGDLESVRITTELKRLRDEVNRRTSEIAEAIRMRGD
ncbi:MAG TPA: hypothetical protein VIG24_07550 [Acidimicrobiia bacterium]